MIELHRIKTYEKMKFNKSIIIYYMNRKKKHVSHYVNYNIQQGKSMLILQMFYIFYMKYYWFWPFFILQAAIECLYQFCHIEGFKTIKGLEMELISNRETGQQFHQL